MRLERTYLALVTRFEDLEFLATRNEKENSDVAELRLAVERMQAAKADKILEREKYEQELEQLEDTWRQEVKELLTVVARLQEDNRKLNNAVQEKEGQAARIEKNEEEETRVMTRLKDTVDKQRAQIKELDRKLRQQAVDMEAMQLQLEKIARQNVEARKQSSTSKTQTQQLLVEKAELETLIQEREQQIGQMMQTVEEEENKTASIQVDPSPYPTDEMDKIEEKLHLLGKMVIDLKDPNRPRFTMGELREVLLERNELKTKLLEIEEELKLYKPREFEEECLPVQGPVPLEPLEKLYPGYKEESGIKRFFKSIFGSSQKSDKKGQAAAKPYQPRTSLYDSISIASTVQGVGIKLETVQSVSTVQSGSTEQSGRPFGSGQLTLVGADQAVDVASICVENGILNKQTDM